MKYLILFALFFTSTYCVGEQAVDPPLADQDITPEPADPVEAMGASDGENIVAMVNLERFRAGLLPLQFSDQLTCASSLHATYLWRREACDHRGPGLQTFETRAQMCGGVGRAEVLACGQTSFVRAVSDWLGDARHRSILMDQKALQMGAARMGEKWVGVLYK